MMSCPLAGPGPANSGPGPTVWVRGQQKVARPDLDRTVDTKMHRDSRDNPKVVKLAYTH